MDVKPGSRWKSAVCTAEVVIVRPPSGPINLECGGHPMVPMADERPEGLTLSPDHATGVLIGKRYTDADTNLEALGSKKGDGSLSIDGRPLTLKEAKALPSSD
jgi:hypothetical protein